MRVVFDTSILLLALFPGAKAPDDPETGSEIENARDRVEYLIERLDADGAMVMVPTPALAEALIKAGPIAAEIVTMLTTRSAFQIVDFDQMAAIETAASLADALRRGGLKIDAVSEQVSRSKVKFDRQIAAIAKVNRATQIYSDDRDLKKLGEAMGIEVIRTKDLPLRPADPQQALNFDT